MLVSITQNFLNLQNLIYFPLTTRHYLFVSIWTCICIPCNDQWSFATCIFVPSHWSPLHWEGSPPQLPKTELLKKIYTKLKKKKRKLNLTASCFESIHYRCQRKTQPIPSFALLSPPLDMPDWKSEKNWNWKITLTSSSWLNCALRDDEAVYWASIGHYEAIAFGNWWCWVSRGHLCLYILHKVEVWTGVTDALRTHFIIYILYKELSSSIFQSLRVELS